MREILFRGKDVRGRWYFGLLAHVDSVWYISNGPGFLNVHEVIPNTIGQYTETTDKNGTRIFEGDIIEYSYDYPDSPWLKAKGKGNEDIKYHTGDIFWQTWRSCWAVGAKPKVHSMNQNLFTYNRNPNRVRVIGNIHDNPELIEVGKDEGR